LVCRARPRGRGDRADRGGTAECGAVLVAPAEAVRFTAFMAALAAAGVGAPASSAGAATEVAVCPGSDAIHRASLAAFHLSALGCCVGW
jgi:hypothetical protein